MADPVDLTPGPSGWSPTCRNCRRPIKEKSTARFGWTHDGDWQGVRCAGGVTGAVPDVQAAYRAGREEAARDIGALLEDQKQRAAANSDKLVRAMRAPVDNPDLPGIKTHGWTLAGRVDALEEAVKVARASMGTEGEHGRSAT